MGRNREGALPVRGSQRFRRPLRAAGCGRHQVVSSTEAGSSPRLALDGFAAQASSYFELLPRAYVDLYGLMAVMGVIVILAVQSLVSVAILRYFWLHHGTEVHWWSTVLAPIISFVGQGIVLVLLFQNIAFIAGTGGLVRWLGPIDAVIFIVGIGLAFYLKSNQPDKYKTLGRLIHDGL